MRIFRRSPTRRAGRRRDVPSLGFRVVVSTVLASTLAGGLWVASAEAGRDDPPDHYYVSIGDSYAAGYRPYAPGDGATSKDGFPYQLAERLDQRGGRWELVNFACSGESAHAMATEPGCEVGARAPDSPGYQYDPQAIAAGKFIAEHRDRIGLITVVMGANDVMRCLSEVDPVSAQSCVEQVIPDVVRNLDAVLSRITDVAESVPVVGISYINVFLADTLKADPSVHRRAETSRTLFSDYLNPALRETYSRYGARFIDVTELAGGYLPRTEKTWLPEYGTVIASVGRVCALTYYCADDDPHPNRAGHALIADQIEKVIGT